jgi:hypothetical protein
VSRLKMKIKKVMRITKFADRWRTVRQTADRRKFIFIQYPSHLYTKKYIPRELARTSMISTYKSVMFTRTTVVSERKV